MEEEKKQPLKLISLIVKENPRAVFIVCSCLLISSMIEALGVSAIFPLISLVLETEMDLPESRLAEFILYLKNLGPYLLSIFVIISFVIKSLILNFTISVVAKSVSNFSYNLRDVFIRSMFDAKIHFIFSRSLGKNLAVLTTDSINASSAYISATRVLAGLFQLMIYVSYALWLSVEATFLSAITMGVLFIMVKTTMDKTRKSGKETTHHIHDISKNMGETLRGTKEAKATATEKYFIRYIDKGSSDLKKAHKISIELGQRLRNIQDPVTVASALFCLLLFKDVVQLEPSYIIFILAVYYRLMTSLNMTLADYQKFLGRETALWSIKENIEDAQNQIELTQKDGVEAQGKPEKIFFDQVSIAFDEKKVLNSVSFNIAPNKLTLLRGESGKGKTTTIDMICSLVQPDAGEIRVGHTPLTEINTESWRKTLGYVDQFPFLFKASIKDNIVLNCDDVSEEDIQRVINLCHLKKFIESQEYGLDFVLNEGGSNISGGQRQRIAIARAVVRKPQYLILDEPTSALDHESEEVIFQTLKELSNTMSVIVVSHSKDLEKYADDVINFDQF